MALRPFPSRAQVVLGPALGGVLLLPCRRLALEPLPPGGILRTMVVHACTEFGPGDVVYEAASLTAFRQSPKKQQRCTSSQSGAVGEFMRVSSHGQEPVHILIYDQEHLDGEELIVMCTSPRSISTSVAVSSLCA